MKVLIVCSGNNRSKDFDFQRDRAFIYEQVESLKKLDVEVDVFLINQKGMAGYLSKAMGLREHLKKKQYDIIHAHYGLSGIVPLFVRKQKKIITYHGSDIHLPINNLLSTIIGLFFNGRIFVSDALRKKILYSPSSMNVTIPCGVNFDLFFPKDKIEARRTVGLMNDKRYVLFPSNKNNYVKNYPLAQSAVEILQRKNINVLLLELSGYSREGVNELLNAVDAVVMTSFTEGSPQIIKEAMAVNKPIVSVIVGDVKQIAEGIPELFLVERDASAVAEGLEKALVWRGTPGGREKIITMDNKIISRHIKAFYEKIIKR